MPQNYEQAIETLVADYENQNEGAILADIHSEDSHVVQFDHPTLPLTLDVEFTRQPNNDFWEWQVIGDEPKHA